MLQLRGSRIEIIKEGNNQVKVKVPVGEVQEPKVRVASVD